MGGMNKIIMKNDNTKLYKWAGLNWNLSFDLSDHPYPMALCPNKKCNCELSLIKERPKSRIYTYNCIKCDFSITLNKTIVEKGNDFIRVWESLKYHNAEIINIDGELIRIQREEKKDNDYWIDVKISKNKKDELQLMVLAGSRKTEDKVQLFLDPKAERLAFDQNNDHPTAIFTKVTATFKNSMTEIHANNKSNWQTDDSYEHVQKTVKCW